MDSPSSRTIENRRLALDNLAKSLPPSPPADGILLVDKPVGPTSHDVVNLVRRHYQFQRKGEGKTAVGHAGTLDPLASGLLIVLIGKTTKQAKQFEGLDKVYQVSARLGQATTTYDAEGAVVIDCLGKTEANLTDPVAQWIVQGFRERKTNLSALTKAQVEKELTHFQGELHQTVPPFAAVKLDGRPLYDYARQGSAIPWDRLPSKQVQIYAIELTDFTPADEANPYPTLSLNVHVSKGTYIRSLIHDLGQALNTGAHVTALRRTVVGGYRL